MNKYYFLSYPLSLLLFFLGNFSTFKFHNDFLSVNKMSLDTINYHYGSEKTIEVWKLDHYSPEPGKLIGIWPSDYSVSDMITYRTHWGYRGIFLSNKSQYKNALEAGYKSDEIMMSVAFNLGTLDYREIILSCNAGRYYIDETVNHSCYGYGNKRLYNPEELRNVREFIHTHRKGSEFVSSGYKRCTHFDTLTTIVDKIMYSGYSEWYVSVFPCLGINMGWGADVEFAWLPGSEDQRGSWMDMKKRYGSKFTMTWVNSYEITEFDDLFAQAVESDLNEIWIYTLDEHHSDQFGSICQAAYHHGFLKRILRKYQEIYKCICREGSVGFKPDDLKCWRLEKEIPTSVLRED